ncbi:hypothetical protein KO02_21925 [Sphingobacterium sp. ML3W]|uniref:DUF3526 domain-containing protein n=1 Tax=Sphingobacterium sp. ML3W TaxID=1538644 RepID=UPI0004F73764|nr:DUF3526 domain-containing protein [Sphingobacterium sp. ML3W]AIM39045.1 hypothetical protein KO02_21925 [Sphingobacterium sp. ML3W]
MKISQHIKFEILHFSRSRFKVISLFLFLIAAVYGLQSGWELFQKQTRQITAIESKNAQSVRDVLNWYDTQKKGPEEKYWIDITTPYWASMYAPITVLKKPSTLLPFSIGQTEQYGYYKNVNIRSSVFDADLAEEISNPERLSVGTLDFGFVVIYLLPLLIIILLFNVGGLEKDLDFYRLIEVQQGASSRWLIARYAFYYGLLGLLLLLVALPYAYMSGALYQQAFQFFLLPILLYGYMLLWFVIYYLVNREGKGSASQAIKMVSVWVMLSVILPGSIHQFASLKYPMTYLTDFLEANRDELYKLQDTPPEKVTQNLFTAYPELAKTKSAMEDSIPDKNIIGNSLDALINISSKQAAKREEKYNETKNGFIKSTYLINPVLFFQNTLNALCGTDYYAYQQFRSEIQTAIDKKAGTLLFDTWNKEVINKENYLKYLSVE